MAPDPGESAPGTLFAGFGIDDIPLTASGFLGPVVTSAPHPLSPTAPADTPSHTDWLQVVASPILAAGPTDYRVTVRLDHVIGSLPPPTVQPIPDPSSWLMLVAGLSGLAGFGKIRRTDKTAAQAVALEPAV